jgi:hypothetical protein
MKNVIILILCLFCLICYSTDSYADDSLEFYISGSAAGTGGASVVGGIVACLIGGKLVAVYGPTMGLTLGFAGAHAFQTTGQIAAWTIGVVAKGRCYSCWWYCYSYWICTSCRIRYTQYC